MYRYDDRDNRTPVEQWTRTITDLFDSGESEAEPSVQFRTQQDRVVGRGALRVLGLAQGVRVRGWLRPHRDRSHSAGRLFERLKRAAGAACAGGLVRKRRVALRAGVSRRDPDDYDPAIALANEQNPLMRKYNHRVSLSPVLAAQCAHRLPRPADHDRRRDLLRFRRLHRVIARAAQVRRSPLRRRFHLGDHRSPPRSIYRAATRIRNSRATTARRSVPPTGIRSTGTNSIPSMPA